METRRLASFTFCILFSYIIIIPPLTCAEATEKPSRALTLEHEEQFYIVTIDSNHPKTIRGNITVHCANLRLFNESHQNATVRIDDYSQHNVTFSRYELWFDYRGGAETVAWTITFPPDTPKGKLHIPFYFNLHINNHTAAIHYQSQPVIVTINNTYEWYKEEDKEPKDDISLVLSLTRLWVVFIAIVLIVWLAAEVRRKRLRDR